MSIVTSEEDLIEQNCKIFSLWEKLPNTKMFTCLDYLGELSLHVVIKDLFILYRRQKSIAKQKYLESLIICCDNFRIKNRQNKKSNYTGVVEEMLIESLLINTV